IIFNYDRCIEQYLENALQIYFAISLSEAQSLLRKLKTFHPYGSVGKFSWQIKGEGVKPIRFGAELSPSELVGVAGGIKTFTERLEDEDIVTAIKNEVATSEVIVFLGFAFHDQNLDLIAPVGDINLKNV